MRARLVNAASVSRRLATRFTRSEKTTGRRRRYAERTEGFIVEQGIGVATVRHEPDPSGSLRDALDRQDARLREYAAFLADVPGLAVTLNESGIAQRAVSVFVNTK